MSYIKQVTLTPRRNLFSIFEKGKDFFLIRTIITLMLAISLLVGCAFLSVKSWQVYPTVIRDDLGNAFVGKGATYTESYEELLRIITVISESLFIKTEKGLNEGVLEPYFKAGGLQKFTNVREGVKEFNQRGQVLDIFIADNVGSKSIVYVQVDVVKAALNSILTETLYFRFMVERGERTMENPAGIYILAIGEVQQAEYRKVRRESVNDSLSSVTPPSKLLNTENNL